MDISNIKFGYSPSKPDVRNYNLSRLVAPVNVFPDEFELDISKINVEDQGDVGCCHDDQTEVLTNSGWKLFKNITLDDKLATVNPNNKEMTFENPTNIISYFYEGDMHYGKHQSLDFAVTPNHRMLVRKWNQRDRTLNNTYEIINAENLGWYSGLMTDIKYINEDNRTKYILGACSTYRNQTGSIEEKNIDMVAWLHFLGIFVAEGTMYQDGEKYSYRIQIAGFKEREKQFIRSTLDILNIHYTEYTDRFHLRSKQIWKELERLGYLGTKAPFKRVPKFVFNLSPQLIKEYLYGYGMGDGWINEHGDFNYSTSSKGMSDDIQLLIFLSGGWGNIFVRTNRVNTTNVMKKTGKMVTSNYPEYMINQWKNTNLSIDRKKDISIRKYSGMVYCAEVPTYHTLITRRNGKILISGNCVAEGGCYYLAYKYNDLFSLGFMYGNRDDSDYLDHGMEPIQMLKHLKNEGNVLRKDFPLVEEMIQIRDEVLKVKTGLLPKANQYKIESYAQLNTIEDIKNALIQLKAPVLIGVNVYLTFIIPDSTGFIPVPPPELMKNSFGGHCIVIYGFDKRGFKILNSWGIGQWTKDGKAVLDYEYPLIEAWSITDKVAQPPQPTPVNKYYRVQVFALQNKDRANIQKQILLNKGYDVYMVFIDGLYKLQLNAFSEKFRADAFLQKVRNSGYKDAFISYY